MYQLLAPRTSSELGRGLGAVVFSAMVILAVDSAPCGYRFAAAAERETAAAAASPPEADSDTPFEIPAAAVEQARRLAVIEVDRRVKAGLKRRRPKGLEDLDSAEAIQRAIDKAFVDLANRTANRNNGESDPLSRLRYLGDHAYDALLAGAWSGEPALGVLCCHLLADRGRKAVPPLIEILLNHREEDVRAEAAQALGQTYDRRAVPALIESLEDDSNRVRVGAFFALRDLRDARALGPLRKHVDDQNGHVAASAIRSIQGSLEEGPSYWPAELLDLRQLCKDAATLKGESFGQSEIDELTAHLQSDNWSVSTGCAHALASLDAKESVPAIVAMKPSDSRSCVLAQLATVEAIDALVADLKSTDVAIKRVTLTGLSQSGGRWPAPLLVAMLDDLSLMEPARKVGGIGLDGRAIEWPEWHLAHTSLVGFLSGHGLRGNARNLAAGLSMDVHEEMARARTWWGEHGDAFVAGENVPNPQLSVIHLRF